MYKAKSYGIQAIALRDCAAELSHILSRLCHLSLETVLCDKIIRIELPNQDHVTLDT